MNINFKNRFKLNKTWFILGVALVIGVLAALAARSYLSTQMQEIEARSKGKTVNIVVAKTELKRGDKLTADNVAIRQIPLDYAHSAAVTPEAFDRLNGQSLAYPLHAGEMILWGLIEGKRVPTFSARVEVGHRAMTVPVDEINSISGLLEPGDLIDLMVTVDQHGKKITLPLLQNVQVMATGQRSVDAPSGGERKSYTTVTIDTTPEQAQNVIIGREAGKVTALLRNPEDKRTLAGGNADMRALLGGGGAGGLQIRERMVPVIYGGAAKLDPNQLAMGAAPGRTPTNPDVMAANPALPIKTGGISMPGVR